jgi:hypothetical protein
MNLARKAKCRCLILLALLSGGAACSAFSLLGPYASWMTQTNGYREPGDIGGPMNIGQGYRWNVPTVTYAFDQSFLDFFGSNGVTAVEKAIQIINRLPRASNLVMTNYPLNTLRANYEAAGGSLVDLKSAALACMIEQMGLASPTRWVFAFRRWNPMYAISIYQSENWWSPQDIPYYIIKRNFDPQTLQASRYVNGTRYTGTVQTWQLPGAYQISDVLEDQVDPLDNSLTAVADGGWGSPGNFNTGLTRDDVGGLRYLLRTNTLNYEILLPDVHGVQSPPPPLPPPQNTGAWQPPPPPIPYRFVNGALRPGVEKITFARHPYNARLNKSSPLTYRYTDTYIINGIVRHQLLERTVKQPDFLFSVGDLNDGKSPPPLFSRTSTSNWWNSAAASTNSDRTGPGVIRPPVIITFHRNPWLQTQDDLPSGFAQTSPRLGSFDGSANPPIAFPEGPLPSDTNHLTIRLWLFSWFGLGRETYVWRLAIPVGGRVILQASDDLTSWLPQATVSNDGRTIDWYHWRSSPTRFFRVVPE